MFCRNNQPLVPTSVIFGVIIIFFFTTCEKNRIYEKNINIEEYLWNSKTVPSYKVEIHDTSALYNIYINIRHAELYPFQNIWLVVGTQHPDGKKHRNALKLCWPAMRVNGMAKAWVTYGTSGR